MGVIKNMDHGAYMRKVRRMDDVALEFTIRDCREVIRLQADFNPNIGYYMDEIHYCSMELRRRKERVRCSEKKHSHKSSQ
jgi:hypothetical protein